MLAWVVALTVLVLGAVALIDAGVAAQLAPTLLIALVVAWAVATVTQR